MKKFSELDIKFKYDSDENSILESFHIPMLEQAEKYDRAVGFFSAQVLSSAFEGMKTFILSNGKMRLIIGDPLSDEEYDAVLEGYSNIGILRSNHFFDLIDRTDNINLKLLTFMIANDQLEIKFAFTHRGMFHKKIGIFTKGDETVVFSGSANETLHGLSKYNSEEISVFVSWRDSFNEYGCIEVENFNSLWNDTKKNVKVIGLDSSIYQKIQKKNDLENLRFELFGEKNLKKDVTSSDVFFKYSIPQASQEIPIHIIENRKPKLPYLIRGRSFQLHSHQISTIESWKEAGRVGLFKLATGAGKTFTSITAMVKLYEERQILNLSTCAIISVPYIELAKQWIKELSLFNIKPIECFNSFQNWANDLETKIIRFNNGLLNFLCVVVVNMTLGSDLFAKITSKLNFANVLFIGDECHHLGSQNIFLKLPDCRFRIGLSATPFNNEDDEIEGSIFPDTNKQNLLSYFGGIVSEYSLSDAIKDGILTPYRYDLVPVYLDNEEQIAYEEYSQRIFSLILQAKSGKLDPDKKMTLNMLCAKRANLIATCSGKIPALINYIKDNKALSLKHSIFYVGEGFAPEDDKKYISRVSTSLFEQGLRIGKFTSEETAAERKKIMSDFVDETFDGLVAMKVLDEGIDVPICKNAFILASTRNPRQYIQRRGRVLRKADNKEEALIVDFVVLPQVFSENSASAALKKAELTRVNDFKLTSNNVQEINFKIKSLGLDI